MPNLALFDVVIPVVIGWVLVDDLMRSMRSMRMVRLRPVVDNIVSFKQSAFKFRERGASSSNLVVTQALPVVEEKTCSAC